MRQRGRRKQEKFSEGRDATEQQRLSRDNRLWEIYGEEERGEGFGREMVPGRQRDEDGAD